LKPLLEIENLHAWYGRTKVLHGASVTVAQGGITTLLGANGAGKTTLLRSVCSVMVRCDGTVAFEGKPITGARTEEIVRAGVAHVPDGRGTFAQLTVEENLLLGGYVHRDRHVVAEEMENAYRLFPKLRDRRRQQAGTLSGGEQQMLAIGRALMLRPKLILLDEPSFGLAPLIVQAIFETLKQINVEKKTSMLLVEQNAHLALKLADHAYLMETGRTVLDGKPDSIRDNERVRDVYLGA
jgi:branched-chain amino acid transport system ATP-binding protein